MLACCLSHKVGESADLSNTGPSVRAHRYQAPQSFNSLRRLGEPVAAVQGDNHDLSVRNNTVSVDRGDGY